MNWHWATPVVVWLAGPMWLCEAVQTRLEPRGPCYSGHVPCLLLDSGGTSPYLMSLLIVY